MDKPVTNAELDQFYGTEVSPAEVKAAIERHVRAFDADDLESVFAVCSDTMLLLLKNTECASMPYILKGLVKKLISDRVSIELFGRHGGVKADEVEL